MLRFVEPGTSCMLRPKLERKNPEVFFMLPGTESMHTLLIQSIPLTLQYAQYCMLAGHFW